MSSARKIYYYRLPFSKKTKKVVLNQLSLEGRYLEHDQDSVTVQFGGKTIVLKMQQALEPQCLEVLLSLPMRYCFSTIKIEIKPVAAVFSVTAIILPNLAREQQRYRICLSMRETLTRDLDRKEKYEAENILERWLLSLANDKREDVDAIFGWAKSSMTGYLPTIKAEEELKKKTIPDYRERFKAILDLEAEYLRSKPPFYGIVYTITDGILIVDGLKLIINPDRATLLLDINDSKYDLAVLMVRYACLMSRGQQWSIPLSIYKLLLEEYDVTVEGFASPLNSQLLTLRSSPKGKGISFCSLFFDTDEPYGSLGDFFTIPDRKLAGKKILLNPPFIIDVLMRMTDRIESLLRIESTNDTDFFVLVPEWTDASFYTRLDRFPQKRLAFSLAPGRYYFTDPNGGKIPANFASHFFVFSRNVANDYSKLEESMKAIYSL